MAEARFQRIVPLLKVTLVAAVLATAGCSEMLQPLSVEGSKGFNVAGGIAEMTLTFQPG
jgi:hypothetical protein